MKKIILPLLLAFTFVSCSQQKFAFRKKIAVSHEEQQIVHRSTNKPIVIEPKEGISGTNQELNTNEEILVASAEPVISNTPAYIEEKGASVSIQTPVPQQQVASASPAKQQKTMTGDHSGLAIAGFVLSLVGLLLFPIPCGILAIIFGALSLKSSRRGLAIAALIIGIVDVVVGLAIISSM